MRACWVRAVLAAVWLLKGFGDLEAEERHEMEEEEFIYGKDAQ
jgi:hypothetical protein